MKNILIGVFDYLVNASLATAGGSFTYLLIYEGLKVRESYVVWVGVIIGFGIFSYLIGNNVAAKTRKSIFNKLAESASGLSSFKSKYQLNHISKEAELFLTAEKEFDSGNTDEPLMSLAFAKADGNENKKKSEYMKLRVQQLKCK